MQETIRILYFGDVVGTPGRVALAQSLPGLREQHKPHLVIANVENAANGSGLTPTLYDKFKNAGVDGMTLGDHAFRKGQIRSTLESQGDVCRPANLAAQAAGRGYMRLYPLGEDRPVSPVYVIPVLGRLFMNLPANDPFACVDHIIDHLPDRDAIVIVEIHAEATSEKIAMGWHLNKRVAAVLGTHTHVATADARILPDDPNHVSANKPAEHGTACITDLGMCGPHASVLGRRADRVLTHMTTAMPAPFDVADHDAQVHGVLLEICPKQKLATAIEPVHLSVNLN